MANKIYIEYTTTENNSLNTENAYLLKNAKVLELPLTEDIQIEIKSQFSSFGEMVPKIGDILQQGISITSSVSGSVSEGLLNLKNKFDLPKWNKTDPLIIRATLNFFTKTDSYEDVTKPMQEIISLTILSKDPKNENSYIVPGISLATLEDYNTKEGKGKTPTIDDLRAKICAIEIPGIIYLPLAYVETALPTYSKQSTESVNPLWGKLDCQFVSVTPAVAEYFTNANSNYMINNGSITSTRKNALSIKYKEAKLKSSILG